ncbi:protease HtpX, partial [Frischella perrara]|uniref:protease HtpX n=2 Tax=Orbaceae TaxID=1240483 RepID=UPI0023F29B36
MMRVGLFLLTNLAVMFVFGIILSIFGVNAHSILGLLIFAAIFGFGGSFISLLLSKRMALRSVGGEVIKEPRNAQEQWLLDVVRRQSEQLKLKMPAVAIYEADDINAFATGATRNRSLVAVSTGLLAAMTQDEAEAVIGHEMSHVANGDMVTMALLQGVLNTFVIFISRIIASMFAKVIEDRSEALADIAYYVIAMI